MSFARLELTELPPMADDEACLLGKLTREMDDARFRQKRAQYFL